MLIKQTSRKVVYLHALRAFEAAARRGSFVAAAEELSVTPSAVSQHVKALEDYVGVKLFERSRHSVTPTLAAMDAYSDIHEGLGRLAAGLSRLKMPARERIVTITTPPSFAAKWLLPRLNDLRQRYPDLEIRLDTSNRLVDFAAEGIDIGVRYGGGRYLDLHSEKLLDEDVFPVCSPGLLPRDCKILSLAQLRKLPLIHDTTMDFDPSFPTWQAWFSARGVAKVGSSRSIQVDSSTLAMQAAIAGEGVALGRSVIAYDDIHAGRLVRPFGDATESGCAYFVVCPKGAAKIEKVKTVRDWLMSQTRA